MHDVKDWKYGGDDASGPEAVETFLMSQVSRCPELFSCAQESYTKPWMIQQAQNV